MIFLYSYTPAARHALETAVRIAASADDGYIGTEHLLLGLRRDECIGALPLQGFDLQWLEASACSW